MMPRTMSPPPRKPGAKWPGFLINRSGLPFDELTWSELWEFAAYLYPGIDSRIDWHVSFKRYYPCIIL